MPSVILHADLLARHELHTEKVFDLVWRFDFADFGFTVPEVDVAFRIVANLFVVFVLKE